MYETFTNFFINHNNMHILELDICSSSNFYTKQTV